jgi:hypothetical protein
MKMWLIGCGVALVVFTVSIAGIGYIGYVKMSNWNANRKARIKIQQTLVQAVIAQRSKYLENHLPQETRDTIPRDFYTYSGFRDWWRMPLVFPYQLMCIDSRDSAFLEKYDPTHSVSDPNNSSSGMFGGITRIATDNRLLVFETKSEGATAYGILQYGTGMRTDFGDEKQMWAAAKKAGYAGGNELVTVDNLFSAYYDYEKNFVAQAPGGDSLKATHQE